MNVKTLQARQSFAYKFTFATLVTDAAEYGLFLRSCEAMGFDAEDCEFIQIDNSSSNVLDAFSGINRFLSEAQSQYIILCHQDIELLASREKLETQLQHLDEIAPDWALAGNAGGDERNLHIRISDPHGMSQRRGDCPARVYSLDENFIVVKAACRIAASGDLHGFHLYGLDLCIAADVAGYSAWVIDYPLLHKSGGSVGARRSEAKLDFYPSRQRLQAKYSRAFRLRRIRTTCTHIVVPESFAQTWYGRCALALQDTIYKLAKKKQ